MSKPAVQIPTVQISDHALLRYLERVGGFDIEGLRASIASRITPLVVTATQTVVIDGNRFLVKPGACGPVVVTVLEKRMTAPMHPEGQ